MIFIPTDLPYTLLTSIPFVSKFVSTSLIMCVSVSSVTSHLIQFLYLIYI